jgi:hypothetical protein
VRKTSRQLTAAEQAIRRLQAEHKNAPEYLQLVIQQNEKYLADLQRRRKEFEYPTQSEMFSAEAVMS